MEPKAFVLASVVVLLAIVSGTTPPPEIPPLTHERPTLVESGTHAAHAAHALKSQVESCGVCNLHPELSPWQHRAYPSDFTWSATEGTGWHETWVGGGCLTNHPYSCKECVCPNLCGSDPQCLQDCLVHECGGGANLGGNYHEFVDAIRTGTLDAFEMAASRVTFEVNEERSALQVLDRHGAVIVHAPLPVLNVLASGLLAILAVPLMAQQDTLWVSSDVQCPTCRFEVGESRELVGEYEDGTVPNLALTIRQGPEGSHYVVWESFDHEVHVYGPDGTLVRTLGRAGEGPGEFRAAWYLEHSGGILRVGDPRLRRVTEFDAITGELLRTVTGHPVNGRFAVLDDGRFVWSGPVRTRAEAGQPLHIYSGMGVWERSFGVDNPVLHPDMAELLVRTVVPGGGTTFWAASSNEYRIEHRDASGFLIRTIVGERTWFEPWHSIQRVEVSREVPPPPILSGLAIDEEGLLWVLVVRPSDTWRDSFTGELDAMGNPVRDPDLLYATVLEVIDPGTGQLLARQAFPHIVRIGGPGTIWRSWADERGLPRASVTPIRLVGRR